MIQCNTLNIKLSNSQLDKLKTGLRNGTEVTFKISSNVICDYNDENNFHQKFLLTETQVSKLRKAFVSNSSANMKLAKTQLHKIEQSGGFLGRPLGPLLKNGLSLIENVLKPLPKSVLIPLGLIAKASATNSATHNKMFASRVMTLIISNKEMNDIMKIVKPPEESGLSIKGLRKTIKNEAKEQKGGFLSMSLGTLGVSLLGNLLTIKGMIRAGEGTTAMSQFGLII